MKLHVIALPHTTTSKKYLVCAYTQKILNFCRMMPKRGYEVIHYGTEGSDVECEHVSIITHKEQLKLFGEHDWDKRMFPLEWVPEKPYWQLHNHRAAQEVLKRRDKNDLLCIIGGLAQKPIADMLSDMKCCEWGVGYSGVFCSCRVFESYAWMHTIYGYQNKSAYTADGVYYDTVIPNSFDPADFTMGDGSGGYLFFIGRLIKRKGVEEAIQMAEAAGVPLKIAGQGGEVKDGKLYFDNTWAPIGPNVEYIGVVDKDKRNEIMGKAIAVLVPTRYLEPFGGVNVEAQLCGTPAITTDWGAFPETVVQGATGYRCRTMGEYVWAIRKASFLNRQKIRDRALSLYSLDAASAQYDHYFKRLYDLINGKGWYTIRDTPEV